MNEPAGRPGGVPRKSRSGPPMSPILSSMRRLPQSPLKKLQPERTLRRETLIEESNEVPFSSHLFFHLSISTLSLSFSSYRPVFIFQILIYPWTRHISCPLSSQVQPTDIYQPRDITFGRLCRRNCLFEIPTELLLLPRIINRLYSAVWGHR